MEETLIQNSEKYKNDSKIVLDVVKLIELTEEELELKYKTLLEEKFPVSKESIENIEDIDEIDEEFKKYDQLEQEYYKNGELKEDK